MRLAAKTKKSTLVIVRHSPYGSSLARAAIDTALAYAAYEQSVDLLFLGDGVLQLQPEQDTHSQGIPNRNRQLASLPLYDINHVYVDAEAAVRYNLDLRNTSLDTLALDPEEMRHLMLKYHHLLGY